MTRLRAWIGENGHRVALWALVLGFAGLATEAIDGNAVMVDEFAHLPAGISYLELHRFYLYRVNPPLVQGLAAVPAWLAGARMDYSRAGSGERSEWNVGLDFLQANAGGYQRHFSRARSVIALLGIACGLLIYRWASQLHGQAAGLVCASLWLLDPNVLAHSTVVTTDVGAAASGLLATYAFWRFLGGPTWGRAALAGAALGLAQGSKFSMLALYPAFVLVAALARGGSPWKRIAGAFGISLLALNLLYGFDGSFTPLGSFPFKSQLLSGLPAKPVELHGVGNRFAGTILGDVPIPVPKDYALGIDAQRWESELGLLKLSDGHLTRGGRWFSPFDTLSRKLPVGTLLLLGASAVAVLRRPRRTDLAAWMTALVMLGFLCGETSLNWAVRYLLIVLPLLFVAAGGPIRAAWSSQLGRLFIVACLLLNVGETLAARPYYLSFGNQFIGGIAGAQRLFIGSNFDWGQDLIRLKRWSDEHPEAGPIALSYCGAVEPGSVGLRVRGLPAAFARTPGADRGGPDRAAREDFSWAISSNVLNGLPGIVMLDDGSQFLGATFHRLLRPENAVARVGATIFIFRIASRPEGSPAIPGALRPDDLIGAIVDEDQLASRVVNNDGVTLFTSP